jgi:hypothetical protein
MAGREVNEKQRQEVGGIARMTALIRDIRGEEHRRRRLHGQVPDHGDGLNCVGLPALFLLTSVTPLVTVQP